MGLLNWTGLSPLFIILLVIFFISWFTGFFTIIRKFNSRAKRIFVSILLIFGIIIMLFPLKGINQEGISRLEVFILFAFFWFINPMVCIVGLYETVRSIKYIYNKDNSRPFVASFDPERRNFLKGASICSIGFLNAGVFVRPLIIPDRMLQIRDYSMEIKNNKALDIAFISDLHAGFFLSQKLLQNVSSIIKERRPDYIFIGGDIVDHNTGDLREIDGFVDELTRICPVIAVLGNHDILSGAKAVEGFLKDKGVVVLRDSGFIISENISVYGLKDDMHEQIKADFESVDDKPLLILTHNPAGLYKLQRVLLSKSQLVFAGHTHGGQIRLPVIGAMVNPGGKEFQPGINNIKDMPPILITTGIGYTGIPLRINCEPEVVFVKMR
ncbi:MAG TPA: hypothetical protein HPP56_04150 [Nitrospirae bacterium]|nr:hypothetical protein [Nitrospirota bacterium]